MRGAIYKAKLDSKEKLESLTVLIDKLEHPMDLEMDKDGSLVLLEYGSGWWFNTDGSISRLRPDDGNQSPTITIKPTEGDANSYTVDQASDPENGKITVNWYVTKGVSEIDLGTGSTATVPEGNFQEIRAVATDDKGAKAFARINLDHSQDLPSLELVIANADSKPGFGDSVEFAITGDSLPDASLVKVRARYVSPTGHDAGGAQLDSEIVTLATANQCLACHQASVTSVGLFSSGCFLEIP